MIYMVNVLITLYFIPFFRLTRPPTTTTLASCLTLVNLHRCSFIPSECTGRHIILPNICTASSQQVPNFNLFALQSGVLELQDILKQLHWVISKWPWTFWRQRYNIYVLRTPMSHNFTPFRSTTSCFRAISNTSFIVGHQVKVLEFFFFFYKF